MELLHAQSHGLVEDDPLRALRAAPRRVASLVGVELVVHGGTQRPHQVDGLLDGHVLALGVSGSFTITKGCRKHKTQVRRGLAQHLMEIGISRLGLGRPPTPPAPDAVAEPKFGLRSWTRGLQTRKFGSAPLLRCRWRSSKSELCGAEPSNSWAMCPTTVVDLQESFARPGPQTSRRLARRRQLTREHLRQQLVRLAELEEEARDQAVFLLQLEHRLLVLVDHLELGGELLAVDHVLGGHLEVDGGDLVVLGEAVGPGEREVAHLPRAEGQAAVDVFQAQAADGLPAGLGVRRGAEEPDL